jgi:hypothetical protein
VQDEAYFLSYAGVIPFACSIPYDTQGNAILSATWTMVAGAEFDFDNLNLLSWCTNQWSPGYGISSFATDDSQAC